MIYNFKTYTSPKWPISQFNYIVRPTAIIYLISRHISCYYQIRLSWYKLRTVSVDILSWDQLQAVTLWALYCAMDSKEARLSRRRERDRERRASQSVEREETRLARRRVWDKARRAAQSIDLRGEARAGETTPIVLWTVREAHLHGMRLKIVYDCRDDSDAQMRVRQHQRLAWITWRQTRHRPALSNLASISSRGYSFGNHWAETILPWTTQPENWLACRLLSSQSQHKSLGLGLLRRSAIITMGLA